MAALMADSLVEMKDYSLVAKMDLRMVVLTAVVMVAG